MKKISNLLLLVIVISLLIAQMNQAWANAADPVSSQILIVDLIKKDKLRSSIEKVDIRQGFMNPLRRQKEGESLQGSAQISRIDILNKYGQVLFTMNFGYPELITVPMSQPGNPPDALPALILVKDPRVSLIIPHYSEAAVIQVFDGSEAIVPSSSQTLSDIFSRGHKNEEAKESVHVPFQQGKFNLLIMASGYTDENMNKFQTTAEQIKDNLLINSPFYEKKSNIAINIYNNKSDLGCYTGCNGIDRLICCDQNKVISNAASSSYFYDEIVVIHRTDTYAGGGYRDNNDSYKTNSYNSYCVVYDGSYATVMSLHEFGHSFGNLCDEYSYTSEGYTYFNCVNCRSSCSDYTGFTSTCTLGCDAKSDYFRPDNSVMFDLTYNIYNQASIKAEYSPDGLEKRLQYFITTTQTAPLPWLMLLLGN